METWDDVIKYFRKEFPYLLAPLTDAGVAEVVSMLLDDISQKKVDIKETSQEVLLKRYLRHSDSFINLLYEDEIYNKDIPKRMKAEKFFYEVVPERRKLCRQKFQSGEKISLDQMERVVKTVMKRKGIPTAVMFALDHVDLVDTSNVVKDSENLNRRTSSAHNLVSTMLKLLQEEPQEEVSHLPRQTTATKKEQKPA